MLWDKAAQNTLSCSAPYTACCAAAGYNENVAEQFLNSQQGRDAKRRWEQAQSQEDIQECLNIMIPALLRLLHGRQNLRSRSTYFDTHGGAPSEHAHFSRNIRRSSVLLRSETITRHRDTQYPNSKYHVNLQRKACEGNL